jgi:protein required for attachment to host cells
MTRKHEPRTVPETWIVVADRTRARIFQVDLDDVTTLDQIESLENPEGSAQPHEVESSRAGYLRSGVPEAAQPATDFAHKVAERFARRVVEYLEHGRETNRFGHLVLVAAPLFLGVLRKQLSPPLERMLKGTVDKDYVHLTDDDLVSRIGQWVSQNG